MFQIQRSKTGFAKAGKLLPALLCRFKNGGWSRRKENSISAFTEKFIQLLQ
jgi:hypothetical protein